MKIIEPSVLIDDIYWKDKGDNIQTHHIQSFYGAVGTITLHAIYLPLVPVIYYSKTPPLLTSFDKQAC